MSDAYDLRSNIKDKPGSQGTLFQVKDKGLLNPEQRWPHGYTPERLNAVRDAVKDTRFETYAGANAADTDRSGKQTAVTPQRLWEPLDRDHFAKTVAKTTVPADDLKGITEVNHKITMPHALAEYRPASRSIGWSGAKASADRDLVHEIGHHVDNMRSRDAETMEGTTRNLTAGIAPKHVQEYWEGKGRTGEPNETVRASVTRSVSRGIAEGYADNYYTEHYRGPGRKHERASQGRYEDIQTEESLNDGFPGYRDVRPAQHMGPQFSQEALISRDQVRAIQP